jgi:hypothetical protein
MNRKQSVVLKNFEIKGLFPKLVDKWGEEYFLIINNDKRNDDYFCFKKSMRREGWHTLAGDSFMG